MSDRDVLIRALEASGEERAASLARAILPADPTPVLGSLAPPAEEADPARERYEALSVDELSELPQAEFTAAIRVLKGS